MNQPFHLPPKPADGSHGRVRTTVLGPDGVPHVSEWMPDTAAVQMLDFVWRHTHHSGFLIWWDRDTVE